MEQEVSRRRSRLGLALLALGLAGVGGALGFAYSEWAGLKAAAGTQTVTTLQPTSNVVSAVRDLANLETVSFHMERVIDLREQTSQLFGLVQAEDAILLVAAADVVGGIDLSALSESDVQIDQEHRSVRVFLPPPRVLSARLDNERTYVHTRSTDALARRSEGLETKARQAAEQVLREAALNAGLLPRAQKAGARAVEGLLRSLGFTQVSVEFREE
ncbi:MAG: DUF4230 domain-containing protein [Myxococcales bacterium]